MRKESRIINYIPRQFQDRLSAVSTFDYSLREDKRYQTRIKMGLDDLELHKKLRGTTKWERVPLPSNLPPVDLSSRPAAQLSNSPPPGRPGHDYSNKRGRGSTGSDTGENSSKIAKQNSEGDVNDPAESEESFEQLVEKADLVSEVPSSPSDPKSKKITDPGIITSVQGTPSQMYPSLENYQQSPIISRSGRKN